MNNLHIAPPGYVEDIYQVLCSALIDEETLRKAKGDLLRMTPLPMNSMLDKQSKSEAISKKARRQSMPAVHFPPTKPGFTKRHYLLWVNLNLIFGTDSLYCLI